MTDHMNEQLLTVEEVAERLRLDPEAVRRYLRSGELRGMRFGNRGGWRISEVDLAAFLAARRPDPYEQTILNQATADGAQNPRVIRKYDIGRARTIYAVAADWPQNDPMWPGRIRTYVMGQDANLNIIIRAYTLAFPIEESDLDAVANTLREQIDSQGFF
jgi:excisionase family DNA binding protein